MIWLQKEILLSPKPRGFHLVTDEIINYLPEIKNIKTGLLSILLQHTSASITLNENFDPGVRADLEKYFNKNVRENEPYYEHNSEGADDMPAHIKSVLIGNSITIPLTDGKLNLGTWQGIYLCEHRNAAGARKIVATIAGI
ncbi:MAG TPA: secondary thiamine-phosphate synthase enzyme YjbQ [Ignavibacteriaceae bacterium]|nr:secondary thiamine-phosphate synthase enzyme YjbQ [Ignavibacteriaceae bacterium]